MGDMITRDEGIKLYKYSNKADTSRICLPKKVSIASLDKINLVEVNKNLRALANYSKAKSSMALMRPEYTAQGAKGNTLILIVCALNLTSILEKEHLISILQTVGYMLNLQ